MDLIIFATPFFSENAQRFLGVFADLPVRLAVISQDPQEILPAALRERFVGHWRVADALSPSQVTWAVSELSRQHGRVRRLIAASEQMQDAVAAAREKLGIEGMRPETTRNFRDKARMKYLFRQAGVPCAKYQCVVAEDEATRFAEATGYPLIIKPLDGAASQATFKIDNASMLRDVVRASGPSVANPLQLEEFVTGEEHSFETVSIQGQPVWHSLTRYLPTPLDAMRNPWIQWRVILPREIDTPQYDDIRAVGPQALRALGMGSGLTHMEWFRRQDGSLAISEVAARPPGAQIVTLMSRAHDFDMYEAWARLMVFDEFTPPPARKYAAGAAFLRGLGAGRVRATHGLDAVLAELGDLVTDVGRPTLGQEQSRSYEGEGYVVVRHPDTRVVEEALLKIVSGVRVELVA
ncbi:MAG TPA: ATP-grasp domain-containing protein [Thermoflexales bacterium]|nr:ATP-grasp domain-containing protein [Anaerolineae bacterium]HQV29430.1 ATP-grasp domain-containing protein [Thermoflexales bacterium]HQX11131.1 ATP-grasp domain-containing protein [Thermoflexales bacterium]HQY26902.1 ATP-grasp domain-containing protein [Thermoflexales bacterium]HQZ53255.1 ATP-grasp domain-containing protein [Thermoflexales bacterium]